MPNRTTSGLGYFTRLSHLFIDGGYKRPFADWVKQTLVHTLRHSFATHLLESGYDIRTVRSYYAIRT